MNQDYPNESLGMNLVIMARHGHAFPELYIRGIGWMSFEPTVSTMAEGQTVEENQTTRDLSSAGIFLIIVTFLFLLGAALYPEVSHRYFMFRFRRMSENQALTALMKRICKLYRLNPAHTAKQIQNIIIKENGTDISKITNLFDRSVYGGYAMTEPERQSTEEIYLVFYDKYKQNRKHQKR